MTKEEKQKILEGVKWTTKDRSGYGGQHVGVRMLTYTLSHDDFEFSVSCGEFRNNTQNKNICLTIFELFLDSL